MANIKSAIKRIQVAERNRLRNKSYKSAVKTLTKNYLAAVDEYAKAPSPEGLTAVQGRMSAVFSKIDKATKCGVYHANTGARRKAKISKVFKQLENA
ncbi:MAG: 30S ribosomal protein S20 [Leptolyngbyaceae cyanobacterium]